MIVSGVGRHIYCLPTAIVSDAVQFVGYFKTPLLLSRPSAFQAISWKVPPGGHVFESIAWPMLALLTPNSPTEYLCPDCQHPWYWTCQGIGLPVRVESHRSCWEDALTILVHYHYLCLGQPYSPGEGLLIKRSDSPSGVLTSQRSYFS